MGHPLDPYLRVDRLPHIWCPGCGIGIVLGQLVRAVLDLGMDWDRLVVVSGIGCSGRLSGYVKCDAAHVLHGRAIPFAEGVKLARPELKVVVVGGDGDILSIGGNHLIHAARRGTPISVIMVNNMIYGMTGGQLAPTTPISATTTTTPKGNPFKPLNAVLLAACAGATYVARWTVAHPLQLRRAIAKLLSHEGFGFLEVVSTCPVLFGRLNRVGSPSDFMRKLREITVVRNGIHPAEAVMDWPNVIVCGEFKPLRGSGD